jgi:hypothetical protein
MAEVRGAGRADLSMRGGSRRHLIEAYPAPVGATPPQSEPGLSKKPSWKSHSVAGVGHAQRGPLFKGSDEGEVERMAGSEAVVAGHGWGHARRRVIFAWAAARNGPPASGPLVRRRPGQPGDIQGLRDRDWRTCGDRVRNLPAACNRLPRSWVRVGRICAARARRSTAASVPARHRKRWGRRPRRSRGRRAPSSRGPAARPIALPYTQRLAWPA